MMIDGGWSISDAGIGGNMCSDSNRDNVKDWLITRRNQ